MQVSFEQENPQIENNQDSQAIKLKINLNTNINNLKFNQHPSNTQVKEVKYINIPYSAEQMDLELSNKSKAANKQPSFESNFAYGGEKSYDNQKTNNRLIRQFENKQLFSNKNLNYINANHANNAASEDFNNFEKPFISVNQARNNHIKFSNTEIPEVFDDVYIQRRINKAEINSPNHAFAEILNSNAAQENNSQYHVNDQSFNPPKQSSKSNIRRISSSNSNFLTQHFMQ